MPEEEKKTPPADEETSLTADEYAAAIKNLKAKTVSKEEYDKLKEENKTLVKALAGEGPAPEGAQETGKKPDIKELRKKFLTAGEENLSNAETVQTALELRKALIDSGERDPFLPQGMKIQTTPQDIATADRVAETLQKMLDEATDEEGYIDEEMFNAQLRKNIAEDSPLLIARLKANAAASKKPKKYN